MALTVLIGIPMGSAVTGCRHLDANGVYKGDTALYQSELATTTSYDLLDAFVKWEAANRAALAKWPEIKKSADTIRADAKQWFSTANALHDAYAANPTDENRAALQKAINVIRAALVEANGYMLKTATQK